MSQLSTQPPRPRAIGGVAALVAREELQPPYPNFLPAYGLFASAGGMMTPPCRVMLDCGGGQVMAGAAQANSGSALDPMPLTLNRETTQAERQAAAEWVDALLSQTPTEQPVESADTQHALIAVKDGQAFQLLCFGPITEGPERAALDFLMGLGQPDA